MYQPPKVSLGKDEPKRSFPWGVAVAIIIFLVVIAGGGWFFFFRQTGGDVLTELQNKQTATVPTGTYQAVFLDNGQTYFGELKKDNDDFYILTNVYYLQSKQGSQSPESLAAGENASLVKLGNEMHGPEDEMRINKAHILFIEDLKGDSKVSKAITDYLSNKK